MYPPGVAKPLSLVQVDSNMEWLMKSVLKNLKVCYRNDATRFHFILLNFSCHRSRFEYFVYGEIPNTGNIGILTSGSWTVPELLWASLNSAWGSLNWLSGSLNSPLIRPELPEHPQVQWRCPQVQGITKRIVNVWFMSSKVMGITDK